MNKYLNAISSNYLFFGINTIFFLLITSIALQVMGEELYGLWIILNAILLFSGAGMMGMGMVVNKFGSEAGESALPPNKIISSAIVILLPIALLVMGVILIAKKWLATQFGLLPAQEEVFSLALTFTALSIVPQFLGKVPQGYLLSQLKNHLARPVESGVHIAIWSGAVAIAYFGKDLAWMALWGLVVQTLGTSILFFIVARLIKLQWHFEPQNIRKILNFSGFTLLENLAIALFQQFDRILVGLLLGPAAAGVYSLATSVGLRIPMIVGQASEVMIPYASLNHSLGNQNKLLVSFRKLSKFVNILTTMISSILILWIGEILQFWITPEYSQKYKMIFQLILFLYGLLTLSHSGRQTLIGIGKIKLLAITYFIASSLMLITIYLITPYLGLSGAILANGVMVTLLLFNIVGYKTFSNCNVLRCFILDNGLGITIMALTFTLIYISDTLISKTLASLLILGIFFIFSYKNFSATVLIIFRTFHINKKND